MMNLLLLLFAIPFAVIVISIALQKLLKCPFLVAAIILSIFLVIGFATNDTTYLIAGIIYTIISFITAYLTKIINECRNGNNNVFTLSNNNNNFIQPNNGFNTLQNNNGITGIANNNLVTSVNNNTCRCNQRWVDIKFDKRYKICYN